MKAAFLGVMLFCAAYAASASSSTLSLLTYNIHTAVPMGYKGNDYKAGERDLHNLADVITSAGADLVALQEVHCEFAQFCPERQRTSALNQARLLGGFTGLDYCFASAIDDTSGFPGNTSYLEWGTGERWTNNGATHGEYGNTVLSRFCLAGTPQSFALPKGKADEEQRVCLRVELDSKSTSGVSVVLYATHLQHTSEASRLLQIAEILRRAGAEPKDKLVFLMGDMNHDGNGPDQRFLDRVKEHGFFDLYAGCVAQPPSTCPADTPTWRIDYVFASRPLKVSEARVIDTLASDHRPVLVRVELP
jgi:endonuclease/exonuclease/phosphatase family metal-dependent hydrolase